MTPEQAIAFYLFAFVAAGTPGPSNVMLTATGAIAGLLRGMPCLFGVVFGMGFMMFAVAAGLGGLVLDNPTVLKALNWAGAAFLLWLAWKIATSDRGDAADDAKPVGFFTAAGFQWVNPKSWLVCASAVGTYLSAGTGSAVDQAVWFGLLFMAAALPTSFVWLAFGAGVQRLLTTGRAMRIFNVTMGGLLAASVLMFVF